MKGNSPKCSTFKINDRKLQGVPIDLDAKQFDLFVFMDWGDLSLDGKRKKSQSDDHCRAPRLLFFFD
jgi:hypothetical protein